MSKPRYLVKRDDKDRDWIYDFISRKWRRYGLAFGVLVYLPAGKKYVRQLEPESYRFRF